MKVVLSALAVVAFIGISEAQVCKSSADCGSGQCCYIQPQFLVASKKRQLVLPQLPLQHDTGVCEAYRLQGDQCNPLETVNGHCGCGAGLSCQWVDDPTPAPGGKRSMIFHPGPGAYKCA